MLRAITWFRNERRPQRAARCTVSRFGTLLAVAAVGLGGCAPASRPTIDPDLGFVAVVGAGQDDPLWPVLRGSALRLQDFVGRTLIRAEAPPTASTHGQAELIQQLRREGMRGLCIQVIDPIAIAPHLKRLSDEGVVVVTMLRPIPGKRSSLHCGVDQGLVGEALADAIAEALHEVGTVAVLHANSRSEGSESPDYARERYEAFSARLQQYPKITVLREFDCGGNPQRAQAMMRKCMERFPRLNGWVAMDNWPLRDLPADARLLPATCRLVTTDPDPQSWDNLTSGMCYAMVGADYPAIVREAVVNCVQAMDGKAVRWPVALTAPRVVRAVELHGYKTDWMNWCVRPSAPSP